ncbi:MAG: hypothetical protein ACHQD8_03690 [Chitinophagales bacterium]
MKYNFIRLIFLLALLVFVSSCGRTVYRAKAYKSNKYIKHKTRNHWWHFHHYRPHERVGGGYW